MSRKNMMGSNYATQAMDWATRRYLINGDEDGYLNPQDTLTRAQTAQIIYKFTQYATRS